MDSEMAFRLLEVGDFIELFEADLEANPISYRIAICLNELLGVRRVVVVFSKGAPVTDNNNYLSAFIAASLSNAEALTQLHFQNEMLIDTTSAICILYDTELGTALNVFKTPKRLSMSVKAWLQVMESNMRELNVLRPGDIVEMEGSGPVIGASHDYNHHLVYTDDKYCKVVHKFARISQLDGKATHVQLSEDKLLEVTRGRHIRRNNHYDFKYASKVRSSEAIVRHAYDMLFRFNVMKSAEKFSINIENSQHFCSECRYGIALSIFVELAKVPRRPQLVAVKIDDDDDDIIVLNDTPVKSKRPARRKPVAKITSEIHEKENKTTDQLAVPVAGSMIVKTLVGSVVRYVGGPVVHHVYKTCVEGLIDEYLTPTNAQYVTNALTKGVGKFFRSKQ